jgi:hypothetical protein
MTDAADRLSQEALEIYERTLGLDHPDPQAFLDDRRLDADFDPPPL